MHRARVLWASPLPPVRSGVSDYAAELLPDLAARVQVRVATPPDWVADPAVELGDVELVPTGARPDDGEISIVHLGNNPYHEWLLGRALGDPGIVVLHEPVLHHLLVESTVARGDHDGYEATMVRAHAEPGRAVARARRLGLGGRRLPFLFPAFRGMIHPAATILVHSRWAGDLVRSAMPDAAVRVVAIPAADPGPVDREQVRASLGVRTSEIVLMHLGFLTPEKGLREIVSALAAAAARGCPVRLVVVGEGTQAGRLGPLAEELGIGARVSCLGWVPAARLRELPAAADLGVVLRTPSAGESSAAAVRFLAAGTPVAVGGRKQFLELPLQAAPRLTPGASASADLARILFSLADPGDRGAWQQRRLAARRAYETTHRPEVVAEAYQGAVDEAKERAGNRVTGGPS